MPPVTRASAARNTDEKREPPVETASGPAPTEEQPKPRLVRLPADDDDVGVCNLNGECPR
jgi:hypothetical protein